MIVFLAFGHFQRSHHYQGYDYDAMMPPLKLFLSY
jgi:hypothetical protein